MFTDWEEISAAQTLWRTDGVSGRFFFRHSADGEQNESAKWTNEQGQVVLLTPTEQMHREEHPLVKVKLQEKHNNKKSLKGEKVWKVF